MLPAAAAIWMARAGPGWHTYFTGGKKRPGNGRLFRPLAGDGG